MSEEHQRNEPETGQPEVITVPQQANAETAGEADSAGRRVRILILEDEAWDAELAQRLLTQRGREPSPPSSSTPGRRLSSSWPPSGQT